jgi:hypothetical protein
MLKHLSFSDNGHFLAITQTACTRPGMKPRRVNRMLIQKCFPNPTCRKTPTGGRKIARRIRIRSTLELLFSKVTKTLAQVGGNSREEKAGARLRGRVIGDPTRTML